MGKTEKGSAEHVTRKVGADDIAPTPGRTSKVTGPTGHEYVDRGSNRGFGSFLDSEQRKRLETQFQMRCIVAESNYQHGAQDVRIDKLLEKNDHELSWIASFLLDAAFGFIGTTVGKAVMTLKAANDRRVSELISQAIMYQVPDPELGSITKALGAIDKSHIDGVVAGAKTEAVHKIQSYRESPGADAKKQVSSYLDQLRDTATIAFQRFRETTPAQASDVELLTLFESMDAERHLISLYKVAISEKLRRFEESNVSKIGRQRGERPIYDAHGNRRPGGHPYGVVQDVWVEWHSYVSGYPPELVFHYEDGEWNPDDNEKNNRQYVDSKDPSKGLKPRERKHIRKVVGGGVGISNDPRSIVIVPREFRSVAIQRHHRMWGAAPKETLIDDSSWFWDSARASRAAKNKAMSTKQAVSVGVPPRHADTQHRKVFEAGEMA